MPRNGEKFSLDIVHTYQDRMDSDKIKDFFGPDKIKEYMKTIDFDTYKTTRIAGDKPKFQMPNLANATISGLIDMLGQVRDEKKDLEKLEGIYKDAIAARIKAEEAEKAANKPNSEELSKLFKQ